MRKKLVWFALLILLYFGLELWLEHSAEGFYQQFISPYLKWSVPSEFFIGSIIFIYLILDREKQDLKEKLDEKNQLLARDAEKLLDHYKEIKSYMEKEVIIEVLKRFTKGHEYVLATQLYNYSITRRKTYSDIVQYNYY